MHYQKCNEHLEAILEVELTPYTQNDHYYEASKDKFLTEYKDLRAGRTRSSESGDISKVYGGSREGSAKPISKKFHRLSQYTSPAFSYTEDPEKVKNVIELLVGLGYSQVGVKDLGKLNPPDEYENELRVMAEVRGYFKVAYKVCGS